MYARVAGTMSVNDRAANISFASFLRDRMNNQLNAPCHQFRTRLGHPLPVQTINNRKVTFGGYSNPLFKQATVQAPFSQLPPLVPPLNMTAQEQAYFKDYIRDPDDLYLSTNLVALPPAFQQHTLSRSLWSGETYQPTFAGPATPFPLKIENSPAFPTPSVLPRNVDVSRYENVSYEDWSKAPTLYESSSPSSVDYHHSLPATPDDLFSDYSVKTQSATNMPGFGMNGPNLSTACEMGSTMTRTENFNASSMMNHPLQDKPNGLPPATLLDIAPYAHPVYFHHHSVQQCRSPSPDSDLQSQATSDDDPDDVSSSGPPLPYKFILAKDDVVARQRRDDLIVRMRNEGHSYRDIKRLGRFKEAESTLRGRYRALTKDREDRVRKPQWQPNDETLLRQAVRHYTHGVNKKPKMKYGRRKLPWKKISQRMLDHGSSYDFAPATCAKKWEELGNER